MIFGSVFFGLAAISGWSHPLGNFSLNHYNSLEIHPGAIITQHVLDFAEIPSFNELTRLDTDGDNKVEPQEMRWYKKILRSRLFPGWSLMLKQDENTVVQLVPEVIREEVILSRGEGGLTCLQIQIACIYQSDLLKGLGEHQVVFRDRNLTQMGGVHEIRLKSHPGVIISPAKIFTADASIPTSVSKDLYTLSGLEVSVIYTTKQATAQSDLVLTDTLSMINPESIPQVPLFPAEDDNYHILKSPITPSRKTQSPSSTPRPPTGSDNTPWLFPDQRIDSDKAGLPASQEISTQKGSAYSRSTTDSKWANFIGSNDLSPAFVLMAIGLSILFGASHALSPGHGKTIVAAYLVGTRGTIKHAIFLGLVVTLTHVSSVFLLGLLTLYFSQYIVPDKLYPIIESGSGLIIIGIGTVLFLRRYAVYRKIRYAERFGVKRNTHVHLHHQHNHSHNGDHEHAHPHPHGLKNHTHEIPANARTRDLLLLGITGGIVPCPSAIVVLMAAIALHRILFGLALIVFFSIGLATVLIAIGILMVTAKVFFDRFQNQGKSIRWLQIISPILITMLGFAIFIRGMQAAGIISI